MSWVSNIPANFKGTMTAEQYRLGEVSDFDEVHLDLGPDPYDEGGPCRMFAEVIDVHKDLENGRVVLAMSGAPKQVAPDTVLHYR